MGHNFEVKGHFNLAGPHAAPFPVFSKHAAAIPGAPRPGRTAWK